MKKVIFIFLLATSLSAQVQLGKGVQIGYGSGQGSGTVNGGTTGQVAQYPANGTAVQGTTVTGDATLANGGALTLSTVNSNPGNCGDATHVGQISVNGKGLTTNCTPVAITFPSAGATLKTNGSNNASQSLLNLTSGTGITVANTSGGNITFTSTAPSPFSSTPGVVFNTSTTASRNAAFSDIVPLWGSGSCSGLLKSDGTCPTIGGTGTTIPSIDGSAPIPGQVMQPTSDGGQVQHVLTTADVPTGLSTTGVIAEYSMINASGTTLPDISGNGHTAALSIPAPMITTQGLVFNGSTNQSVTFTDSASWSSSIKAIEVVYTQIPAGGTVVSPVAGSGGQNFSCFLCSTTNQIIGPLTYVSGSTGCTNGTQVVTFSGGAPSALGTITVSGGVPTGNATLTNNGAGYTALPTTGTIATCTGTATFSGGSLSAGKIEFISSVANAGLQQIYPGTTMNASGSGTHVAIAWTDGTNAHIAIDGQENGYTVNTGNNFGYFSLPSYAGAPFAIGYSPAFPSSSWMGGNIYYMRFLSVVPPIATDSVALQQIVQRRGVSFGTVNRTYASSVTYTGDSRTFGTGSGIAYGTYTNTYLNVPYDSVQINGNAGFQAGAIKNYFPSRECLSSSIYGTRNDNVLWNGTNDVFQGVPPATAWQSIQQEAGALRSCGFRHVFLVTEPDRGPATGSVTGQPIGGTSFAYVSGGTGCTNGTQAVTGFNGGGSGAVGSILVAGGVPTGNITFATNQGGTAYTSPPTTAQVATCTGTSTFTGGQLVEQALNALERAQWAQSFDGLVDVGTNNILAPNGTNSGVTTYYETDRTHFNAGGYTTVALYTANAINAFYGSSKTNCDPITVTTSPYNMQYADGCKIFDSQAGASVVNFTSALGLTNRQIHICNNPSGTGSALTLNVATTTLISDSSGTVSSGTIPIPEYFNKPGTTTFTVPVNTCVDFRSAIQSVVNGGSFWQSY